MTRRRETTVQDLPDECLACVLSHLRSKRHKDAASLTCRLWRALVAPSRHSFCFDSTQLEEEWPLLHHLLLQALHTFPHIFHLTIDGHFLQLPHAFLLLLQEKGLPQLKTLNVLNCDDTLMALGDTLMGSVALGCAALTHLSVRYTGKITDAGFRTLADGCRHLVSLDLHFTAITDVGMDVILTMCPNMMEIIIYQNDSCLSGWGFRHGAALKKLEAHEHDMSDAGLEEALQGATSLRTLRLYFFDWWPSIAPIGEYCKILEELFLDECPTLDNFDIQIIAEGCKELRVLHVEGCDEVSLYGWQVLARSSFKLEDLDVQNGGQFCGDSLIAIQNGCPKLRCLMIFGLFPPSDPAIQCFRVSRPNVQLWGT